MYKIDYNKFEYSLNAMLYCIWLMDIQRENFAGKVVDILLSPIPKYLFSKGYKIKYYEHLSKDKERAKVCYNRRGKNFYINNSFNFLCSSHLFFFSSIILSFVFKYVEDVSLSLIFLAFFFPSGIGYTLAYRAVFIKERYIKYFKQFEKESEQWHKKWRRIAITFYVFGMIAPFLGIGFMWCMLFLF